MIDAGSFSLLTESVMGFSKLPERRAPRIAVRNVFDAHGRQIKILPDYIDAEFMRTCFRKTPGTIKANADGSASVTEGGMVRAQIPYLVTLLVYKSKFQLKPEEMEWILYAPGDLKSAAKVASQYWKRWFKPDKEATGIAMEDDYPRLEDGIIVEPIDDKFFDECWGYVKRHSHKSAGHPERPWLFTCLEADFAIYKHTDRQAGLIHRI